MKKKSLYLILLFSICIFIPRNVFAERRIIDNSLLNRIFNYSTDIDYTFKISNENNDDLHFKLYDKTNTFVFNSKYNHSLNSYYFMETNTIDFSSYNSDLFSYLSSLTYEISSSGLVYTFPRIHYPTLLNFDDIQSYNFNIGANSRNECEYGSFVSAYSVIPMILEETTGTGFKKIVFSTIHLIIYADDSNDMNYFIEFNLINNNHSSIYDGNGERNVGGYNYDRNLYFGHNYKHIFCEQWSCYTYDTSTINSNIENVKFMRNSVVDYTDELWNKYNSEKIASSEMQYDNSDNDLDMPKVFTLKTIENKAIYSKYKSNVNYRFKVKSGNGMNFKLHDLSNTFNFSSKYDKDSDTYSIVDNSSDTDYQEGIKEFSKIIVDEVKNNNFSELGSKYNSITSKDCTKTNCHIYTYMPLILEGESGTKYAKQIVLGLLDIQYRQESGNDYYDISLNLYNNTCDLLNSNIDAEQSDLINLSRAIEKDYSSSLINKYSDGSVALEDIYKDVDVNNLKDEYCKNVPVITLRRNPKTFTNGVYILVLILILVAGCTTIILKRKNVKM